MGVWVVREINSWLPVAAVKKCFALEVDTSGKQADAWRFQSALTQEEGGINLDWPYLRSRVGLMFHEIFACLKGTVPPAVRGHTENPEALPQVDAVGLACAEASETGASAVGVMRTLLTELLVADSERTRIVIDRPELSRLFEGRLEDVAWEAFSPRLQIRELLEDTIEYLEAEIEKADAEPIENDSGKNLCTCWFTTPGADFDVILQTLRRARNHHFVGLVSDRWPHGPTVYILEAAGQPFGFGASAELPCVAPAMTTEEAIHTLSSCLL